MIYKVNNELRSTILIDGTAEARLADIFQVMDSRTFPKRESETIVGGPGRLRKLVETRKVRMISKANGRSYYNASDILRHAIAKSRSSRKIKNNHEKDNKKRSVA